METAGIFTICLQLVRWIIDFLPKIFNLLSINGGLLSQILGLCAIYLYFVIGVPILEKIIQASIWLMHKFE